MAFLRIFLPLLALTGGALGELQPIVVKGSKLFYKNGTQFFIKGVAYQQDIGPSGQGSSSSGVVFTDPLANEKLCQRDVPLLQELGTNTIRTYAIDPEADHSACMKLLDEAGIYVISDLGEPRRSINRDAPEWNLDLFGRYQKVIDELAKYPNVIGFLAGNEVTNQENNTEASAYVKAAVRDSKKYIRDNKAITRWLGVGYATNDHADLRGPLADYFACDDADSAIDFWGYNVYSWCGESDFHKAKWDKQVDFFRDYPVPVFLAEYGCNEIEGGGAERPFTETEVLYSDLMSGVFSGGIAYMYFQEANNYGLVKIGKDGKVTRLNAFNNLKKHVAAKPKGVSMDDYSPSGKPRECPAVSDTWRSHQGLPPSPDAALCDCMVASLSCVPRDDLATTKFGDMFDTVCGRDPNLCVGIGGGAAKGVYGAYAMCDSRAKLAYVVDAYYQHEGRRLDACSFAGQATTQKPAAAASCSAALASASAVNKYAATATAPATGGKGKAGSDNKSAAGPAVALGLYLVAALAAGAMAVLL